MVLDSDGGMYYGGGETPKSNLEERVLMAKLSASIDAKVRQLNDVCWGLCMDKTGSKLDSKTATCLNNCVDRFFDTALFIQQRFFQSIQNNNARM